MATRSKKQEAEMEKKDIINGLMKLLVGLLSFLCTKVFFDLQTVKEKLESVEKGQIYMMTKLKIPIPGNLFGGSIPVDEGSGSNPLPSKDNTANSLIATLPPKELNIRARTRNTNKKPKDF